MALEKFVLSSSGNASIDKDPDAVLDYTFDWERWLTAADEPADVLDEVTFSLTGSGAIVSDSFDAVRATAWISGGTAGETMSLRCRIRTVVGRIDDRTVFLRVRQR